MNLYTVIAADKYEVPVLCDVSIDDAADFLHTTSNNVRQLVCSQRIRNGYKVVVSKKNIRSTPEWKELYKSVHNRDEYYREYYRRNKYVAAKRNVERIQIQSKVQAIC